MIPCLVIPILYCDKDTSSNSTVLNFDMQLQYWVIYQPKSMYPMHTFCFFILFCLFCTSVDIHIAYNCLQQCQLNAIFFYLIEVPLHFVFTDMNALVYDIPYLNYSDDTHVENVSTPMTSLWYHIRMIWILIPHIKYGE